MSIRPPVDRTPLHIRQVECKGYLRHDGMFDIEGHITDVKTIDATMTNGRELKAGQPWHEMVLSLCIDHDFTIRDADALTLHGPTVTCGEINGDYRKLIGLRIGPGFSATVREIFRGRSGCTHLTELLGPIATTAIQTISGHLLAQQGGQGWHSPVMEEVASKLIDSCHVWSADGETVMRYFPELQKKR